MIFGIQNNFNYRSVERELRVFVSYSRADAARCDTLVSFLISEGFDVLLDRRSLPYGEEFKAELAGLIARADATIWLLSERSIASEWCQWEIGEIDRQDKRLVPVLLEAVDLYKLPSGIARLQLLPRTGLFDLSIHGGDLASALRMDQGWLREHTHLSDLADRWMKSPKRARLLKGSAIDAAERWRDSAPKSAPAVPERVRQLITASKSWRHKVRIASLSAAVASGIVFFLVQSEFSRQQQATETERSIAAQNLRVAVVNETERVAALSLAAANAGHVADAFKLALAAWPRVGDPDRPMLRRTIDAFRQAMSRPMDTAFLRHNGRPTAAAFTADGRFGAAISHIDGSVNIWDLNNLVEIGSLPGVPQSHAVSNQPVRLLPIQFSTSGSALVFATADGLIRRWSVAERREILPQLQFGAPVAAFSISPNGNQLAIKVERSTIQVVDFSTGIEITRIEYRPVAGGMPGESPAVNAVTFSPDGRFLAIGFAEGTIYSISASDWRLIWQSADVFRAVHKLTFSPDGRRLAIGGSNGDIYVINSSDGTQVSRFRHGPWLSHLELSSDSRRAVTLAHDRVARIWDIETGNPVGASAATNVVNVAFSPRGSEIITSSSDGSAQILEANSGRALFEPFMQRNPIIAAQKMDRPGRLMSISAMGRVSVWNLSPMPVRFQSSLHDPSRLPPNVRSAIQQLTAEQRLALERSSLFDATATSLDVSRDTRIVAITSNTQGISLFSLRDGSRIDSRINQRPGARIIAMSDTRDRFVFRTGSNEAFIWDFGTDSVIGSAMVHPSAIETAIFMSKNDRILTVTTDGIVVIWDEQGSATSAMPMSIGQPLRSFALSKDETRLATVDMLGRVKIWNTRTGELREDMGLPDGGAFQVHFDLKTDTIMTISFTGILTRHGSSKESRDLGVIIQNQRSQFAVFSPLGSYIAISSNELVVVHETLSGRKIGEFPVFEIERGQPVELVLNLQFSVDERRLVTISSNNRVRVWDVMGRPLSRAISASSSARARLSPDGAMLVIADNAVRVFDASQTASGDAFEAVCEALGEDRSLKELEERFGIFGLKPICGSNRSKPIEWSMVR